MSVPYTDIQFLGDREQLKIMYAISLFLNAKVIVELGTGGGDGCRTFNAVANLTDGKVYTVDIDPNPHAKEYFKRFVTHRVTFITADSVEYANAWNKGDIDVLFSDSDHSYERTCKELLTWNKFHPKVIFVHDTLGFEGRPYRAMVDFCKSTGRRMYNFNTHLGLGIIA